MQVDDDVEATGNYAGAQDDGFYTLRSDIQPAASSSSEHMSHRKW